MEMYILSTTGKCSSVLYKLKMIIQSPMFVYSLAALTLLMFSSTVYISSSNSVMLTLTALLHTVRGDISITQDEFSSMLYMSGNGYYMMFGSVIAAIPFLLYHFYELNTGYNVFRITRKKQDSLKFNSYVVCALSAFVLLIIATLIYDILIIAVFRVIDFNPIRILTHNFFIALSCTLSSIIQLMILGITRDVFSSCGLYFTINYYANVAAEKESITPKGLNIIVALPDSAVASFVELPTLRLMITILFFTKILTIITVENIISKKQKMGEYSL